MMLRVAQGVGVPALRFARPMWRGAAIEIRSQVADGFLRRLFARMIARADGIFLVACAHRVLEEFEKNRPIVADSR